MGKAHVSHFGKLDHEKGAFRLLLALERNQPGLIRKDLALKMREEGVGRSAMISSLETCMYLRLVEVIKSQFGTHFVTVSMLTELGHRVALKLLEIESILEDASSKRES